jgi:hypothetical protein
VLCGADNSAVSEAPRLACVYAMYMYGILGNLLCLEQCTAVARKQSLC